MVKQSFNENWTFRNSHIELKNITLPHDAQLYDGRTAKSKGGSGHGYFNGDIYNYEKNFFVPVEWKDKHVEELYEEWSEKYFSHITPSSTRTVKCAYEYCNSLYDMPISEIGP